MDISVCILLWTAQTYTFITELYRHNSFFFDDRPIGAGKKGNSIYRFREEVKQRD